MLQPGAGGNSLFAARANKKTAAVIASYPKKIESGKELKAIQGIGKGSQDKVSGRVSKALLLLNAAALHNMRHSCLQLTLLHWVTGSWYGRLTVSSSNVGLRQLPIGVA